MEEILRTIIENLVDDKDSIEIEKEDQKYKTVYKVRVNKDEMGKVIGRQGKIAYAIRTVMKSAGAKEHKKVDVEFVD